MKLVLKKWSHSKKAVSAIVSMILLVGLAIASSAIAYAYILPQIRETKVINGLNINGESFTELSSTLESLIQQPQGTSTIFAFMLGSGVFTYDRESTTELWVTDSTGELARTTTAQNVLTRFYTNQRYDGSTYTSGAHYYFNGPKGQDQIYLLMNGTVHFPVTLINITNYPGQSDIDLVMSFMRRPTITYTTFTNAGTTYLDVSISRFYFVPYITSVTSASSSYFKIELTYLNSTLQYLLGGADTYDTAVNSLTLHTNTRFLYDTGSTPESPFSYTNASPGAFRVRVSLQFFYIQFKLVVT